MTKILCVVGARPNFMKIDPVLRALQRDASRFSSVLLHTGQHYDDNMSRVFFRDLGLRPPDIDLGVGSGTHAEQTAAIMVGVEQALIAHRPDLILVVGDVNSTLATVITAAKLHIPVGHVEAGLRSFDRRMPEEINRIVTDALSTYLFTPSRDADEILHREGIPAERISFVGNVMIDSLRRCQELAAFSPILDRLALERGKYAVLTLHRPSNVDDPEVLAEILAALDEIQKAVPIAFPIHPRTVKQIERFEYQSRVAAMPGLRLIPPCGYLDFVALEMNAKLILTDSGGIQEEATVLGIPCLTLRDSTERPITVTQGTNQIVGHNKAKIVEAAFSILGGQVPQGRIPELWDGHAAERIAKVLAQIPFTGHERMSPATDTLCP
jgi:UDP-N-acetylglucosamine 2-epimerase (non-hydrolysing)